MVQIQPEQIVHKTFRKKPPQKRAGRVALSSSPSTAKKERNEGEKERKGGREGGRESSCDRTVCAEPNLACHAAL
jgi:hypothetical protein